MRLIDADCLREYMWHICGETDEEIDKGRARWVSGLWIRYKVFEEALAKQITVEAEPVRRGAWVGLDDFPHEDFECNLCGYVAYNKDAQEEFKYCPNCGALNAVISLLDEVEE